MPIKCQTNLDAYQDSWFPENLQYVPRVGETVRVKGDVIRYLHDKKLPTVLQVVSVTHTEYAVIVELHYRKLDIEAAKLNPNIQLF